MVTWVGLIGELAQGHGKVIWRSQQGQNICENGWKVIVFAAFTTIMFTSDDCDSWNPPRLRVYTKTPQVVMGPGMWTMDS